MRAVGVALMGLWLVACSSGDDDGPMDATVTDTGPDPDGGVRALCPMLETPECMTAETCGEVLGGPQPNCQGCLNYSHSVCDFGSCETPEVLSAGNPVNVHFNISAAISPRVMSFVTAAIPTETAGGAEIACADVYADGFDIANACYNIVDSRGLDAASIGMAYQVFFSKLPTQRKVLLLIWGYEMMDSSGDAIGISCTEFDVGGPDGSGSDVEGDMMRPIQ